MKISSNIIILGAKPIKGISSIGPIHSIPVQNNKSIIEIQIQNLKKRFNLDNVVYIGSDEQNTLPPSIQNPSIHYLSNPYNKIKNNGYGLSLVKQNDLFKYDTTLILFGKTLFDYRIFDKAIKSKDSTIFIDNSKKNSYRIGCNVDDTSGNINNLFYNLNNKLCGIYLLKNNEHQSMMRILKKENYDNYFIFEIINRIIDLNGLFKPIYISNNTVIQIDSHSNIKRAKRRYAKNISYRS